jgi:hypothetical protein
VKEQIREWIRAWAGGSNWDGTGGIWKWTSVVRRSPTHNSSPDDVTLNVTTPHRLYAICIRFVTVIYSASDTTSSFYVFSYLLRYLTSFLLPSIGLSYHPIRWGFALEYQVMFSWISRCWSREVRDLVVGCLIGV